MATVSGAYSTGASGFTLTVCRATQESVVRLELIHVIFPRARFHVSCCVPRLLHQA